MLDLVFRLTGTSTKPGIFSLTLKPSVLFSLLDDESTSKVSCRLTIKADCWSTTLTDWLVCPLSSFPFLSDSCRLLGDDGFVAVVPPMGTLGSKANSARDDSSLDSRSTAWEDAFGGDVEGDSGFKGEVPVRGEDLSRDGGRSIMFRFAKSSTFRVGGSSCSVTAAID